MDERRIYVGLLVLDVYIPHASSLKDKRSVIRSICERSAARFRISYSEIGSKDLLQRASLAFAAVADDLALIDRIFDGILDEAELVAPTAVHVVSREILE
jgi:uncharacterized protein YlxP (DUF503 family)